MFKIFFLTFVFIGFFPKIIFASDLTFKLVPSNIVGDRTVVVEVHIDPKLTSINTVEGIIAFSGLDSDDLFVEIETGGSVMNFWPTPPKYFSKDKVIRFVGGTQNSFNHEALLFRIRIYSSLGGIEKISWLGGNAYLNDGQGTKDPIFAQSLNINLEGNHLDSINKVSLDTDPPYFTKIEIGQDDSIYDGKYFISFNAIDDISGVVKYEIREGGFTTNIFDNEVYVLKDQTKRTPIFITVYDKAGNSNFVKIPRQYSLYIKIIFFSSILFIIIFMLKYLNKRLKNVK